MVLLFNENGNIDLDTSHRLKEENARSYVEYIKKNMAKIGSGSTSAEISIYMNLNKRRATGMGAYARKDNDENHRMEQFTDTDFKPISEQQFKTDVINILVDELAFSAENATKIVDDYLDDVRQVLSGKKLLF